MPLSRGEAAADRCLWSSAWNIRQAELLNIAQTERLFFTTLYQQQLCNLAADSATLSDRLLGVVDGRIKAGLATKLELINAQVAVRQSRRQYHLAEASYQAALLNLRQQLGMTSDTPLKLEGDLTKYHWAPTADVVRGVTCLESLEPQHWAVELADARPDVMAARSATAITRANLNLAKALGRIPDVQAGPIYDTADDGTEFLGVRLQRDFFVFNDGSALADQRASEPAAVACTQQLKRRATNEAAAAIDRYERARDFASEAAREISESPPVELEQVIGQYEAGKADIISVLAIQNNLLQDFRSYLAPDQ